MQIPKEILKAWADIVQKQGVTVVAKGAGVNYRTVKTSLETGVCAKKPYGKINSYLMKEAKLKTKVLSIIADQD